MRSSTAVAVSALALALPSLASYSGYARESELYARDAAPEAEAGFYDDDGLDFDTLDRRDLYAREAEAEPAYYDDDGFDASEFSRRDLEDELTRRELEEALHRRDLYEQSAAAAALHRRSAYADPAAAAENLYPTMKALEDGATHMPHMPAGGGPLYLPKMRSGEGANGFGEQQHHQKPPGDWHQHNRGNIKQWKKPPSDWYGKGTAGSGKSLGGAGNSFSQEGGSSHGHGGSGAGGAGGAGGPKNFFKP